jgi:hypothetical protein
VSAGKSSKMKNFRVPLLRSQVAADRLQWSTGVF